MDQLRGKVDGKVFEILTNEEVNDESLVMINDSDLINMGITQKGPRLIILSMIEKLKSRPSSSSAEDSFEKHEEMTRGWFEKDGRFRLKYLYPVLDQGMIPDRAGLSAITRIACRNLVSRIHQGEKYPDKSDMHRVAKDIVRLFPQLANTRITDASPEESAFFWIHNGDTKGPHSGLVYHRLRNVIKSLPKSMHRYNRSPPAVECTVGADIVEKAQELQAIEATKPNAKTICIDMSSCFSLHQQMLREKKNLTSILDIFPHFRSFKGLLVSMFKDNHGRVVKSPSNHQALFIASNQSHISILKANCITSV